MIITHLLRNMNSLFLAITSQFPALVYSCLTLFYAEWVGISSIPNNPPVKSCIPFQIQFNSIHLFPLKHIHK